MMHRAHSVPALGALALAACLALLACKGDSKSEDTSAPPPIPPVSEATAKQGRDACKAYTERVCACAAAKPELELEGDCELAPSRTQALELNLEIANSEKAARTDKGAVHIELQNIISKCVEDYAQLDLKACPK